MVVAEEEVSSYLKITLCPSRMNLSLFYVTTFLWQKCFLAYTTRQIFSLKNSFPYATTQGSLSFPSEYMPNDLWRVINMRKLSHVVIFVCHIKTGSPVFQQMHLSYKIRAIFSHKQAINMYGHRRVVTYNLLVWMKSLKDHITKTYKHTKCSAAKVRENPSSLC